MTPLANPDFVACLKASFDRQTAMRLWALQVLSGAKYRAQASDNRVRTIQLDAP